MKSFHFNLLSQRTQFIPKPALETKI